MASIWCDHPKDEAHQEGCPLMPRIHNEHWQALDDAMSARAVGATA